MSHSNSHSNISSMTPKKTESSEDLELALLKNPILTKGSDDDDEDYSSAKSIDNVKKPNYLVGNNAKAISACTLYSCCSVGMILVNKSLASR
jgi:hypothetical protein